MRKYTHVQNACNTHNTHHDMQAQTMHTPYSQTLCMMFALTDMEIKDGERLPLAVKDMGSCEVFPHALVHSPNGRSARL